MFDNLLEILIWFIVIFIASGLFAKYRRSRK
jgi:hypothetical protein